MQNLQLDFGHRIDEILPNYLREIVKKESLFLGGGALRSYINAEPISDFDFFFKKSHENISEKAFRISNKLQKKGFKIIFQCEEGKLTSLKKKNLRVQLISERYYENMESLIDSFDFTITQFATDGGTLITTTNALRDSRKRRLHIHKITYPASSLKRLIKYKEKGYRINQNLYKEFVSILMDPNIQFEDIERVYID